MSPYGDIVCVSPNADSSATSTPPVPQIGQKIERKTANREVQP